MLTLKQVIKRLEVLATAHKQINHFLFGDPIEYLTNGEVKYPACFVTLNNGSIEKEERVMSWNFDILFCDLANTATKSQESELDVLSDLSLIAEDFKALLEWHEYRDWYIASSSPVEYLKEEFEDVVLAAKMKITIAKHYDSDTCQVPTDYVLPGFDLIIDTKRFMSIADFIVGPGQPMTQGATEYTSPALTAQPFVFIDGLLITYNSRSDRRYVSFNSETKTITINGGVHEGENIRIVI